MRFALAYAVSLARVLSFTCHALVINFIPSLITAISSTVQIDLRRSTMSQKIDLHFHFLFLKTCLDIR